MPVILKCQNCNKEYKRTPSKARNSSFCSNQCNANYRKVPHKKYNCKMCNKEYEEQVAKSGKTSFCSYECLYDHNRSGLIHLECHHCKKKYTRSKCISENSKYCSIKCLHANCSSCFTFNIDKSTEEEKFNRMNDNFEKYVLRKEGCWGWKGPTDSGGYALLSTSVRLGTNKAYRFSWMLKNGKIPKNLIIRHLCNNPTCTNYNHLEVGTHQDNSNDKVLANRQSKGSSHPASKLNEKDVIKIRILLSSGESCSSIARKYNVSQPTIANIKNNIWWKHV